MLMNVMADVCKELSIPVVDLPSRLFNLGLGPNDLTSDVNTLWQERGYCYSGFRMLFPIMRFDFTSTQNILLVRDPRDILTSLYFSVKCSHSIPKTKTGSHPMRKQRERTQHLGIDEFALKQAQMIKNIFLQYIQALPAATTRVYRYEDIVFKKKEWLEDMIGFLGLELRESKIKAIVDKNDIRPNKENPQEHVRQVTPGNYKVHLSQTTIDKLDDLFRPILHFFQYDSVVSLNLGTDTQQGNIQYPARTLIVQEEHVHRLERDLDAMRQSWSWRLSGPLRWLGSFSMGKK